MKLALLLAFVSVMLQFVASQGTEVSLKQCWVDFLTVPCPDALITDLIWVVRPSHDIPLGKPVEVSWKVSASAKYSTNPYITHTNVHVCPSSFGSCPPPFKNPMRVDSVVIGGAPGVFNDTITLKNGKWIVMLHSVLTDRNLNNTSVVMTQSIIRSVGDSLSAPKLWVDPKRTETEELVQIGYSTSMAGLSLICTLGLALWIRQRLPKNLMKGSHHCPPESVLELANRRDSPLFRQLMIFLPLQ